MAGKMTTGAGLIHAGAGTGLWLVQLSVLIPGLLPFLVLLAAFAVVVLLPVLAVTLVAAALAAIPAGAWVVARRLLARR